MLSFPAAIKVYLCTVPCDMRRSFDGLSRSLGEQYNVCGTPGCQCKDPKKPRKHGPYHQLSYTWRGKSSTRFVRPERLAEMLLKVENYKRFRELVNGWVDLAVELEKVERAQALQGDGH